MFKEEIFMENIKDRAKLDKVKELISKLLNVTAENGATENEVISATLKVQQILAKYDMELSDIDTDTKEDIIEDELDVTNTLWQRSLASIVAENFCVESFTRIRRVGRKKCYSIVFYGYKRHCDVAKEVFKSLYAFGERRGKEIFQEYRAAGRDVHGIKNQFYIGYCRGVKSALDVQSRALMIVTPPEVKESYAEFTSACHMKSSSPIRYKPSSDVYERGVAAGRQAASRKEIVG